jgi:hypothetical protein
MTVAIISKHLKLAEHVRQTWHVTPRTGDGPKDLLDPKYWVHVARNLKPGDKIEVLSEAREWYAEAVVLSAGQFGAKVAFTLDPIRLENSAETEEPEGYEVKWAGPSVKWRVIRKSDGQIVREDLQSREEAATWIKSHAKAMAA